MPVSLTVRATEQGEPEPSLTFDAARIVIGRGASCDVRLPDPSVSQRHAVLTARGPEYQIIDEGSTNGTFVGGVRLSPKAARTLRSGDLVRVGRVWIEVRIDQSPPTPDLALATRDLALALVQQAMQARGKPTVPTVTVVEGPDNGALIELEEEGRVYVVGRGEQCDLPLADVDASREHLQVVRRAASVLVRDLRSKNGTLMGEQPVSTSRDVPWRPLSMLRVGATVLALDEPVAHELGDIEKAADEPIEAGSTPEPPPDLKQAEAGPSGHAPIARVEKSLITVSTRSRSRGVKVADVAIIGSALAIIALSIAALVWVLK
jgi:pSer/pThr/pTyr-binding forkhead associated (FHA) protein